MPFVALFACGRFGFDDEHHVTGGDGGSDGSAAGDGSAPGFTPFWKSGTRLRAVHSRQIRVPRARRFPGTTYVPVGTTTVLPPSTFEQLTQVIE